jgi:hypothetical protein
MTELNDQLIRKAEVHGARSEQEVAAYMPGNYQVTGSKMAPPYEGASYEKLVVTIEGTDSHGWTLDDYVIPRLGSGLMFAKEVS